MYSRAVMTLLSPLGLIFLITPSFAQMQACPVNINYEAGNLTRWDAYTGNNRDGNGPSAIMQRYNSTASAPYGTQGVSAINEYNLGVPGIQVITSPGIDPFGGFTTLPTINGYTYKAAILLGSTSVTRGNGGGGGGGYVRGVSYTINVPAGDKTVPYTMTYAYAMILENGTHNSNEQPLFSATLRTSAGIITCASPSYYLPTLDDAVDRRSGATLDSAAAIANGFSVSPRFSPNPGNGGEYLQDVWTKGWTEVMFDLAAYRGQQVTLTFEADNCIPGGHFSYAYIALRDACAGLLISGAEQACTNNQFVYSIPSLAGATYQWTVPPGWPVISGVNSNILTVKAGSQPGVISARVVNSCTDLNASVPVTVLPATISGTVSSDKTVCAGDNLNTLELSGYRGNILNWISSSDGINYTAVPNNASSYTARNLGATTTYKAVIQNGSGCSIDTSAGATITVDPKSVGGTLAPLHTNVCLGQTANGSLTLQGNTGQVVNWQFSEDAANWNDFEPALPAASYAIRQINTSGQYRTVVKSGVCPAVTSSPATVSLVNVLYPQATIYPADTTICYGTPATLSASITSGTSYSWATTATLEGAGGGPVTRTPFSVDAVATPLSTTKYTLNIQNAGCPNTLSRQFNVQVRQPVGLNAGNDTTAVANQPLQLTAIADDMDEHHFEWSPSTGLDNPFRSDPVARLSGDPEHITYRVTIISTEGCTSTDEVNVRVFKSAPDIFVPNAFTPGKSINNLFRPIAAGIASLRFFRVFNRWGQLVFHTSTMGQGWDGLVNGKPQPGNTYVWVLSATNYLGLPVEKRGTVTLVR